MASFKPYLIISDFINDVDFLFQINQPDPALTGTKNIKHDLHPIKGTPIKNVFTCIKIYL